MLDHLLLFIVALISNIFSAFSGGGAGVIQLPAILFIFNTSFVSALAVHKIATVALGVGASSGFLKSADYNRNFIINCLILGLPFVILGTKFVLSINEELSRFLLGLLITLISIYSIIVRKFGEDNENVHIPKNKRYLGYILICIVAFLNGSLSAGTGLIFTLILSVIFKMSIKNSIMYTLLIVGLFYNLIGAITIGVFSVIDWTMLPSLLLGSFIGGYLGAKLSIQKSNKTIKFAYQIVTLIVGINLLI